MSKTLLRVTFTYTKTTPESAERRDHSEHGFIAPNGWVFPCPDASDYQSEDDYDDAYETWRCGSYHSLMRLRDAVEHIRDELGSIDTCCYHKGVSKVSIYEADGHTDCGSGEVTRKAAHVNGDRRLISALCNALGLKEW